MILTTVEEQLLTIVRELKPHERVEIVKDQNGKPNSYLVHRSQKIMVSEVIHR